MHAKYKCAVSRETLKKHAPVYVYPPPPPPSIPQCEQQLNIWLWISRMQKKWFTDWFTFMLSQVWSEGFVNDTEVCWQMEIKVFNERIRWTFYTALKAHLVDIQLCKVITFPFLMFPYKHRSQIKKKWSL